MKHQHFLTHTSHRIFIRVLRPLRHVFQTKLFCDIIKTFFTAIIRAIDDTVRSLVNHDALNVPRLKVEEALISFFLRSFKNTDASSTEANAIAHKLIRRKHKPRFGMIHLFKKFIALPINKVTILFCIRNIIREFQTEVTFPLWPLHA